MIDDMNTSQLPAGDDQDLLDSGDDTLELEAGSSMDGADALAAQALGTSSSDSDSGDDEAQESDKLADTIYSLQNIIERNAAQLDQISADMKLLREQMKSVFENDSELATAEEQAKTVSMQVKTRKAQLQGDPIVTRLKVEIGEKSEQKKEIEEALSNHLVNFFQLTHSKSFDTSDGDQREFEIKARVKGKGKTKAE